MHAGDRKADEGHVVEAATVLPVSPSMQGLALYRSPSKIMPSLPSHTPHKAGQPLPLCKLLQAAVNSKLLCMDWGMHVKGHLHASSSDGVCPCNVQAQLGMYVHKACGVRPSGFSCAGYV